MPQEECKSGSGSEVKVAQVLPSMEKSAAAGAVPGPEQGAAPSGPAHSYGPRSRVRRWALEAGAGVVALGVALYFALPEAIRAFNTISTDDAYVNGHVTFVASRAAGQVVKVLVDDNNMVHKGDPLVELDKEPYKVQVEVKQAARSSAQADLLAAKALARRNLGTGQEQTMEAPACHG